MEEEKHLSGRKGMPFVLCENRMAFSYIRNTGEVVPCDGHQRVP